MYHRKYDVIRYIQQQIKDHKHYTVKTYKLSIVDFTESCNYNYNSTVRIVDSNLSTDLLYLIIKYKRIWIPSHN